MRRLLLLRHAKAETPSGIDDFARRLTQRGRDDARKIGEFIAARGLAPDRALVSGAARTRETWEIVAAALGAPCEAVEENALYEANRFLILGLLRELPATARTHLVVGHNPGMGEVAGWLTGEGGQVERMRMAGKFPTGALAVIGFDRPDWADLGPGAGRLEGFVAPADL